MINHKCDSKVHFAVADTPIKENNQLLCNKPYLPDQRGVKERTTIVNILPYTSNNTYTHRATRTVHRQVPGT